jgi:hypothetical protein
VNTLVLVLVPVPILLVVAVCDYFADGKRYKLFATVGQILAFAAEVPVLVWVHRSVKDEALALWVFYGLVLVLLWVEYFLARLVVFRIIPRLKKQGG